MQYFVPFYLQPANPLLIEGCQGRQPFHAMVVLRCPHAFQVLGILVRKIDLFRGVHVWKFHVFLNLSIAWIPPPSFGGPALPLARV